MRCWDQSKQITCMPHNILTAFAVKMCTHYYTEKNHYIIYVVLHHITYQASSFFSVVWSCESIRCKGVVSSFPLYIETIKILYIYNNWLPFYMHLIVGQRASHSAAACESLIFCFPTHYLKCWHAWCKKRAYRHID